MNEYFSNAVCVNIFIPNFIISCPKFTGILGIKWLSICDFNDPTNVPLPPTAGQTILFNSYCLHCHRTVNRNSKAGNATSLTSAGSPKQSTSLQAPTPVHSSPPGVHSSATGLSPCYLLLPAQESELTCPASPPMLSSPL